MNGMDGYFAHRFLIMEPMIVAVLILKRRACDLIAALLLVGICFFSRAGNPGPTALSLFYRSMTSEHTESICKTRVHKTNQRHFFDVFSFDHQANDYQYKTI